MGQLQSHILPLCLSLVIIGCGVVACTAYKDRAGPKVHEENLALLIETIRSSDVSSPTAIHFSPGADSSGCITCHQGIEIPHPEIAELTCVDCHGGDGTATEIAKAHVQPKNKQLFSTSKNPRNSYAALNHESPEFIRFMNPGDLRVADETCGTSNCHAQITQRVKRSMMATSALVPAAALYNNGVVSRKKGIVGEAFTNSGEPAVLSPLHKPSDEEYAKGSLDFLIPAPRWQSVPSPDHFRIFDQGNQENSDNRARGTDGKISAVVLNYLKTRLNDPTLWMLGTNTSAGDYRSSGCTACHMVYANDSNAQSSDHFAEFGNSGRYHGKDQSISKEESGHPLKHVFTNKIPSSQCITCHHHQGNGDLTTFQGYIWWDQETELEYLLKHDMDQEGKNISDLWKHNPSLDKAQFQGQNGHGWNFIKVFRRDLRGRLLNAEGEAIGYDSAENYKDAVHLQDIHLEKGMHCIDCHTEVDVHGSGALHFQLTDAITIQCEDCHGTVEQSLVEKEKTTGKLLTSGNPKPIDLKEAGRLSRKGRRIQLRSRFDPSKTWWVPQIADALQDGKNFNSESAYAHTIQSDGISWGDAESSAIAHSSDKIECYTCHSSWNTSCYGCHLPLQTNKKVKDKHHNGEDTFGYAAYLPQVIRTDSFTIGRSSTTKGQKYSPMRSASAVIVSLENRNRELVIHQQETISASGHAGAAITVNAPHTVRGGSETLRCTQCHISVEEDNNAWLAHLTGMGTNAARFIGTYAWSAGPGGINAVEVARSPLGKRQPVIGSNLDRIVYPQAYEHFSSHFRELETHASYSFEESYFAQKLGEWLFVAAGQEGMHVLDIAQIANKSKANKIRALQFSPLGEKTSIPSQDCRFVALPTTLPMDPTRKQLPENQETPVHPIFRYAFIADHQEGLIITDITKLFDGNPTNNFLERSLTFNPGGKLSGARHIAFNGTHVLISCSQGLAVVDLSKPLQPKLLSLLGKSQGFKNVKTAEVQFRYAFVLDQEGLRTLDLSIPENPQIVPGSFVPLDDARGLTVYRTWGLVANGKHGLTIIDLLSPRKPEIWSRYNAGGLLNDLYDISLGTIYASTYAYLANGKNGMQVLRLIGPEETPGFRGFAPYLTPRLIAHWSDEESYFISRGAWRDRAIDEFGNQIQTAARLGSRPLNGQDLYFLTHDAEGKLLKVQDSPLPHGRVQTPEKE